MSKLDDDLIEPGRDWVAENVDLDGLPASDLTSAEVMGHVDDSYPGGIDGLRRDRGSNLPQPPPTSEWLKLTRDGWQPATKADNDLVTVRYRNLLGKAREERIPITAVARRMKAQAKLGIPTVAVDAQGRQVGGVIKRRGQWEGW